jgi:hypothetical protein
LKWNRREVFQNGEQKSGAMALSPGKTATNLQGIETLLEILFQQTSGVFHTHSHVSHIKQLLCEPIRRLNQTTEDWHTS